MRRLDKLLQKEMTRQQFLLTLLTSFVSIFGISGLLGLLSASDNAQKSELPGYGTQNYGP